jgi:type IV secretory pathway VirB10-like protein
MFKFSYGVLTAATIAAAIGPVFAQQPTTPPAQAAASDTGQSTAPAGAHAYFENLKNGDTVTSPFKIQFGLSANMGVSPAGVEKEKTGHHHLLIDTTLSDEEMTQPIIMDDQHKHFGGGQTETIVTLPPGKHTLQLVLANWTHIPFKPPVQSEVITITVQDDTAAKSAADAAAKQAAEAKQAEEAKAAKEALEAKQAEEAAKQAQEAKAAKEALESKQAEEAAKQAQEAKAAKEASEAKQASEAKETKPAKATKTPDESKKAMHRHHHRHYRHHYYHRRHFHREPLLHT